jgi:hypothetical protein
MAFADRFCNRFSAVFWIPSQTRTTIEQEYLRIARTLQLPTVEAREGSSAREVAYLVLEWLKRSRNTNWLLIFDNVDLSAAPDIEELIPSTTCVHGHVVLTSRAPLKLPFAKMYQVGPLGADESTALLKKDLGPSYSYGSYNYGFHGSNTFTNPP